MDVIQRIAEELSVNSKQVKAAVALLDEGSTVPFIARYRKEVTGGLDDTQLRQLEERLGYLRELNDRRSTILESINSQGKLTPELEKAINEQVVGVYYEPDPDGLNRFKVSISPYTRFVTITNTTNEFVINVLLTDNEPSCRQRPKIGTEDSKYNILPQTLVSTLGYQMGFRQITYDGATSYTTEAQFNPTYSQYIYFTLNDYVNNQSSNTYGMLPGGILDSNILGVIPVMGAQFANSFDNNANFINKVRSYNGPVNISKIQVQLISPLGNVLNLHYAEFTFVLQVESLYDNTK